MKKIIALVLALTLVLTATAALASGTDKWETVTTNGTNMTIKMSDPDAHFEVLPSSTEASKGTSAKQKTALWLQVMAQGQIDCTLPLALVYTTNVDGGIATTSGSYRITNNSSSRLVVVSIKADVKAKKTTGDLKDQNPMELIAVANESNLASNYDQYTAKLVVDKSKTYNNPVADTDLDLYSVKDTAGTKSSEEGYFFIEKKIGSDSGFTPIAVTVKTGKLSFVTAATATAGAAATTDTTKGVHLLDIEYVVAIDTHDAVGDTIYGTTTSTIYSDKVPAQKTYEYLNNGTVQEKTGS